MIFPYNDTDRILFITLEIVIDIQEPVNNCPDENIATVKNVAAIFYGRIPNIVPMYFYLFRKKNKQTEQVATPDIFP